MRIYKQSGTKERLFEMFENVNKIKLNENFSDIRECEDCDDDMDKFDKKEFTNPEESAEGSEEVEFGNSEDELEGSEEVEFGNSEDELEGGLADNAEPSDFDPEQISMGIKVEMEHTDDPHKALEIAMDHLTEIPDYYTRLSAMEAEAKGESNIETEESPEDTLLDPSKHWVNDYTAQNVSDFDNDVTDESVEYNTDFDNENPEVGETGEDNYDEMQKLKRGELDNELEDLDTQI